MYVSFYRYSCLIYCYLIISRKGITALEQCINIVIAINIELNFSNQSFFYTLFLPVLVYILEVDFPVSVKFDCSGVSAQPLIRTVADLQIGN